jgi:hypothetical protein
MSTTSSATNSASSGAASRAGPDRGEGLAVGGGSPSTPSQNAQPHDAPVRFEHVTYRAPIADHDGAGGHDAGRGGSGGGGFTAAIVLATGLLVCLVAASIVLLSRGSTELGVAGLLLALGAGGPALTIVMALGATRRAIDSARRGATRDAAALAGEVRAMSDLMGVSDDARRVLNRAHERELLRRAIDEDIAQEDWEAALVLVRELADRFGYRADAEEFRARIEGARRQTQDRALTAAIQSLDALIIARAWDAAFAEASRVKRLFPDSSRAQGLSSRVEQARSSCKQDTERRFLLAAEAGDADEAMRLLRELDAYLTPTEAEPLRELARGVIGKARDNLGARFKLAVQDHRWTDAREVGARIIGDFPNSRMAHEVRLVLAEISQRAGASA